MLGLPPGIAAAATEPTRDRGDAALCRAEVARFDDRRRPGRLGHGRGSIRREFGRLYAVAYARYRSAAATLRTRGPRADAATTLAEARSMAARLGAAPLLDAIDLLARQARLDIADAATAAAADRRRRRAALRPDRARTGGPAPHRRRLVEPADRRRPVHQPEDGQRPRLSHLRQARRREPDRRRRDRPTPRRRGRAATTGRPALGREPPTTPRA